jgi:hypothetical protein
MPTSNPHNNRFVNNVSVMLTRTLLGVVADIKSVVPQIDKNAMAIGVIKGLAEETEDAKCLARMMGYISEMGSEFLPYAEDGIVTLWSRPRSYAQEHDCLHNSAKEMQKTGNTIAWGLFASHSTKGAVDFVFHAVNRDGRGDYYETENRGDLREGVAGVYIPFNFNADFYKKVLQEWKRGKADLAAAHRYDAYLVQDAEGWAHLVLEAGVYWDEGAAESVVAGKRSYIGKARFTEESGGSLEFHIPEEGIVPIKRSRE